MHRSSSGVIEGNLIGQHPMEALCVKAGSQALVKDNAMLPDLLKPVTEVTQKDRVAEVPVASPEASPKASPGSGTGT